MINFSELAKEQLSCPDIRRLKVSPTLRLVTVPVQDGSLLCDTKTKVLPPLVSSSQGLTFSLPYMEYHILEFVHPDVLFL